MPSSVHNVHQLHECCCQEPIERFYGNEEEDAALWVPLSTSCFDGDEDACLAVVFYIHKFYQCIVLYGHYRDFWHSKGT